MIRLNNALRTALILALACAPLLAQKPGSETQWTALNKELNRAYEKKDWAEALAVLDRMIKLGDDTQNQENRGGILYAKACVHAHAGQNAKAVAAIRQAVAAGATDYSQYNSDAELDSIRGDAEFKSLLGEIKAKYGPAPLVWDRSLPAPLFSVLSDDPKIPQFLEMRREFAIDAVVAGALCPASEIK